MKVTRLIYPVTPQEFIEASLFRSHLGWTPYKILRNTVESLAYSPVPLIIRVMVLFSSSTFTISRAPITKPDDEKNGATNMSVFSILCSWDLPLFISIKKL